MNALRHSRVNKRVMLDWLRHCEETGEPFPGDHAIQDRFIFASVEQARTLLADLADAGEITIRYKGGKRIISLGKPPLSAPAPRQTPIARTVTKPDRDVERTVAKIMAIVRRGRKAEPKRPVLTARKVPETLDDVVPPESAPKPPPAQPPAPPEPASEAPLMPKSPTSKRQLNLHVSAELYARVSAVAEQEGVPAGRAALNILARSLDAPSPAGPDMVPLDGKPLVRAAVQRAAKEIGMDLHHFCSRLLDLGLECWNGQREADAMRAEIETREGEGR